MERRWKPYNISENSICQYTYQVYATLAYREQVVLRLLPTAPIPAMALYVMALRMEARLTICIVCYIQQ